MGLGLGWVVFLSSLVCFCFDSGGYTKEDLFFFALEREGEGERKGERERAEEGREKSSKERSPRCRLRLSYFQGGFHSFLSNSSSVREMKDETGRLVVETSPSLSLSLSLPLSPLPPPIKTVNKKQTHIESPLSSAI